MKSYYFFVAYQVYGPLGLLLCTGYSLERMDTGVEDGEFERFGLKELSKKLLKINMKRNMHVTKECKIIFTSINELSKGLWSQLASDVELEITKEDSEG